MVTAAGEATTVPITTTMKLNNAEVVAVGNQPGMAESLVLRLTPRQRIALFSSVRTHVRWSD